MNIIDTKYGNVLPPKVKYFFMQKIKKYSIIIKWIFPPITPFIATS